MIDLRSDTVTMPTPQMREAIANAKAELIEALPHTFLTLHVGPGTFRPVQVDDPAEHKMHEEAFRLAADAAEKINAAQRIIAVGTTVTRVLEHLGRQGAPGAGSGSRPSPGPDSCGICRLFSRRISGPHREPCP